jgi:hypothetical protein
MLLELETVVTHWSLRLGHGSGPRIAELRQYLQAMAEVQVGLAREVRRGWVADAEVVLVVDEFAERLHAVRRPILSTRTERRVRDHMAATVGARHA